MGTPERQPNANKRPNEVGAEESERRRESELAGQRRAVENAGTEPAPDDAANSDDVADSTSRAATLGGDLNADQAKKNERKAEEQGRELPG